MKGNEARVVFFLHPVDQLKDGQVSRVKPLRSSFVVRFLLLLGLLLGLAVLVYVFLQFGIQAESQQEPVSTTEVSFDTTTESAVQGRETEVGSNQTRGNVTATKAPVTKRTTDVISNEITGNDSTTIAPVTEGTTEVRSKMTGNDATTETELPTGINPPGIMCGSILCHQSRFSYYIFEQKCTPPSI